MNRTVAAVIRAQNPEQSTNNIETMLVVFTFFIWLFIDTDNLSILSSLFQNMNGYHGIYKNLHTLYLIEA